MGSCCLKSPSAMRFAPWVIFSSGVVMVLDSRKDSRIATTKPNIIACMTIAK